MKPRYIAGLAGAFVLGATSMALIDGRAQAATSEGTVPWLGLFGDVLNLVEKNYVQPVDAPKVIQGAINGMLTALDRHSKYISPEDFTALRDGRGSVGVGVRLNYGPLLSVRSVTPGGPAATAGLLAGDYLVTIDGVQAGDDTYLALGRLAGEAGTGRVREDTKRHNARAGDVLKGLPIVVLVNAQTAAGSEIIAGALQSHKRARVVGVPTYGAGTIQTIFPLRGGMMGAIRFTTSAVTLPGGRSFQGVGLTPDLVIARDEAEADAVAGRRMGLTAASPMQAEAPPKGFSGDYQLAAALDLMKGARR